MKLQPPIVIVGTGLAGYLLAKELRKHDACTPLTLLTKDDGAFYSKPLLSVALAQKKTVSDLVTQTAEVIGNELSASVKKHTQVKTVDPTHQCLYTDDLTIPYSKLVFACGACVSPFPVTGSEALCKKAVMSVNNLEDYANFRQWIVGKKHITVLGSGLVGLEFAYDLAQAGYRVTCVSQDAYPMQRFFPQPIGQSVYSMISAACGLDWHLQCTIDHLNAVSNNQYTLHLSNGNTIVTDGVLSAIGLKPNIDLALHAGLKINHGIVVDKTLQTSDPNIYALGDCAEVKGESRFFIAPIRQACVALAKNLLGASESAHYPAMLGMLKTPQCPVAFALPGAGVAGQWRVDGDGDNKNALFYDSSNQLCGFALTGACARQKMHYVKQTMDIF